MRLIDVDLLKQNCKCTGGFNDNFVGVDLITLARVIDNQPTAYDVEKVVDELEEVHEKFCKNVVCDELCEHCEEYIMFNKNIEIVKQGGVADDVCEWKMDNVGASIGCRSDLHHTGYVKRTYCPYCGKKIKVGGENDNSNSF